MTLTPHRNAVPASSDVDARLPGPPASGPPGRAGVEAWVMGLAVAVAVAGAALGLNGVLRGWAWYPAALTTVLAVAMAMATLRVLGLRGVLVGAGGFAVWTMVLTFTFFRQHSIAGFIPSADTAAQLPRYLRRASETVLAESTPVAPNAGIVLLVCAVLGLLVILIDTLCVPLALPATSGLGILAILVVPAMVKPQSVGWPGFTGAAVGYLMILACSHWFRPGSGTRTDTARNPGQLKRATVTGAMALALTLLLTPAIPGFEQGIFPQGSRLNPWGSASGLNPMIGLGNSLRSPAGTGRITYATNAATAPYLRSVTVDSFEGDTWSPDDRDATRRLVTGQLDSGLDGTVEEQRVVTAVNTGQFTSPYLPAPYAPESVDGLSGRWSWDPATLSIKGVDVNSRDQQYVVTSVAPKLNPAVLAQSAGPVRGLADTFTRVPAGVPQIVRQTADTVTAGSNSSYAKAMAIQTYLRSAEFRYSLQSPVQGGYDGNGLTVLADFLQQKSGYCIHFASAMAVMARVEGIPSRIAVGYAPGRATGATVSVAGQGALPEFEVDARDAHAWPELYFQGVGWVAFEPTPSRGVVPAYAAEAAAPSGASTNENNDGLIPSGDPKATATPAPAPLPLPGPAGGAAGSGTNLAPLLYGTAGLLLVALLLATPALARGGIRRRRLKTAEAVPPAGAAPAWAELRDLATDYGIPPRSSETPRQFAARLGASALLGGPAGPDAPAHAAAASLTGDFELERYGRPDTAGSAGSSAAERIALVQDALRFNASRWTRLRAAWLPPSLLARWGRGVSARVRMVSGRYRHRGRMLRGSRARVRGAARRLRRG